MESDAYEPTVQCAQVGSKSTMQKMEPLQLPPLNINSIFSFTFIMYYLMVKGQFDLWVMGLHCDFDCNLIFFCKFRQQITAWI